MALGPASEPATPSPISFETEAEGVAAGLPALLLSAERVANAVALGVHGRRRPGMGETFWQFRRYRDGDTPASIDWRRSARAHRLYVRDNEWEAAATVWLWVNRNPTMAFSSPLSTVAKAERAVVLALALATLLVRGGERVGVFGSGQRARADRLAVPRIAEHLAGDSLTATDAPALPPDVEATKFSTLVMISDLLEPLDATAERLSTLAARGLQGHLVQVLDPAEEVFPFEGRHEFTEYSGDGRLIVGRAETMARAYHERLADHREGLRRLARRLGWTFTIHRTDSSASEAMLALYTLMVGEAMQKGARTRPSSETPDALAGQEPVEGQEASGTQDAMEGR